MKKFFREHGIWVLFATAVIAVSLSLMSFFSNTSSPLSNLAGIIASPFRSAYTAVTGWITDKQNYYQDVTALEEEMYSYLGEDYFLSLQQANDALTALSATLTDQQRALLDSYEDASAAAGSAYQDAYARRAFLLAREVYR